MTDRPIVIMSVLVGLLSLTGWAGQDTKEPFEVGQRWKYQHEGPRPGSFEPNDIDGERIIHVVGVIEEPEGKQWIIEDRFTKDEMAKGRLYVNQERLLTTIEFENEKGETAKLKYNPPIPYQIMDMTIGQEKTIETSLKMESADFTLPSTMEIQRLDNETITTPAGEFVDCWHFIFKTKSIFKIKIIKIPFTEERERWYHPKINGLVKEVYRKDPMKFLTWSQEAYSATSTLTSFGKEGVPREIMTARQVENTNQPSDSPQPKTSNTSSAYAVILGMGGVLMIGIYILRKRKKV
ncbi:MAG: LPXTG cell wall anchor domain-containing protein [Sedimentisphaerales bacterium]|nr:LPXTG cell wall anchor domain-containing protein [Sedimentisphaerales bacterium]